MIVRWIAFGDSRGTCGHAHETVVAAGRCAAGDERDRRRAGRRRSDRTVHAEAATEAASRVVALRPAPADPPTRTDLAPLLRAAAAAISRVGPPAGALDVAAVARKAVDTAIRYRIRRT